MRQTLLSGSRIRDFRDDARIRDFRDDGKDVVQAVSKPEFRFEIVVRAGRKPGSVSP